MISPSPRATRQWLAQVAPPSTYRYFVSAHVDMLLIGGLSILMCFIVGFCSGTGFLAKTVEPQLLMTIAIYLMWVCNWPHFMASGYRLYHSKTNVAQYPWTAFAVPVVLIVAMISSLLSPTQIAPYYIKLLLLWSPFHFSGQTLGITLIYAHRAGFRIGQLERTALSSFIFGTFLVSSARAEVGFTNHTYYGVSYPTLGLPEYVANIAEVGMWVCGAAFLVFVVRWMLMAKRTLPFIVLLPVGTQFVWFVIGRDIPGYYEFVPFFHSLQYLLIAWAMQLKERMDTHHLTPSKRFVTTESLRWGSINLVIGIGLFWVLPHGLALTGLALQLTLPVVSATIQMHHFFVDGVIWKLRHPSVRSPLLVNVEQLVRVDAPEEAHAT